MSPPTVDVSLPSEDNFDNWFRALGGDIEQIERITNFFPTLGWFEPGDEVEERALEILADRIALGWRAQAARQFPDRPLVAEVVEGTEDDGPTVVLYTRRPDAGQTSGAEPVMTDVEPRATDLPAVQVWCRRSRSAGLPGAAPG